jgi:uncharacterized protein
LLILLPPSETKRPGGLALSIDKVAIIWAALDPAREKIISALAELLKDEQNAIRALKLGKNPAAALMANKYLMTSPTLPAIERYTGTLFDALDYQSLSPRAKERVERQLFIQSALFGLLPATELIPDHKFSSAVKLPSINLRSLWIQAHSAVWPRLEGEILDLRSKSYQELAPVPDREPYSVEILNQDSGKALNHFNKKSKGAFVRAAMELGLESPQQIPRIAKAAGFSAELDGRSVIFRIPRGY